MDHFSPLFGSGTSDMVKILPLTVWDLPDFLSGSVYGIFPPHDAVFGLRSVAPRLIGVSSRESFSPQPRGNPYRLIANHVVIFSREKNLKSAFDVR